MMAPTTARVSQFLIFGVLMGAAFASAPTAHADTTVTAQVDGRRWDISQSDISNAAYLTDEREDLTFIDTAQNETPAQIRFSLDHTQPVDVEILDLQGQVVRTVATGLWARGDHQLAWHGDDDEGKKQIPGLYVVRMRAADSGFVFAR